MKRLLSNVPFDVAYIGALVIGLVYHVEWVANIALFMTWLFVVAVLLSSFNWAKVKAKKIEKEHGLRTWYFKAWDWATDTAIVLVLAGTACWWTAGFAAFTLALKQAMSEEIDKELGDEAKAKASEPKTS